MTIGYCGIIVSARACKRLTAVRRAPRDPNGQRQSKKPFNSPPTDIKSSINFMSVISSGNVATFKLGNLSGLMQSSDRRAYNELFFCFAGSSGFYVPAQLATLVDAWQGVVRMFFNAGKKCLGRLTLTATFFRDEPKLFGGGFWLDRGWIILA